MRAGGAEKMNRRRRIRAVELRGTKVKSGEGSRGRQRRIWWKQKATRQEGGRRSWIIGSEVNVQKQFGLIL